MSHRGRIDVLALEMRRIQVGRGVFKLFAAPNYDSGDEKWEFVPGSLVECEERILEGEEVLVAVKAHCDTP